MSQEEKGNDTVSLWGLAVFGESSWWLFLPKKPVDQLAAGWVRAGGYWLYADENVDDENGLLLVRDPQKSTVLKEAIFTIDVEAAAIADDPENGRKRFLLDRDEKSRLDTMFSQLQEKEAAKEKQAAADREKLAEQATAKANAGTEKTEQSPPKMKTVEEPVSKPPNDTVTTLPPYNVSSVACVERAKEVAWYVMSAPRRGVPLRPLGGPEGSWWYHEDGAKSMNVRGKISKQTDLPSATMLLGPKRFVVVDTLEKEKKRKPETAFRVSVSESTVSLDSTDSSDPDSSSSDDSEYLETPPKRKPAGKRPAPKSKRSTVERDAGGVNVGADQLVQVGCDDYCVVETINEPAMPTPSEVSGGACIVQLADGTLACYDPSIAAEEAPPQKMKKMEADPQDSTKAAAVKSQPVVDLETELMGDLLGCIGEANEEKQKLS